MSLLAGRSTLRATRLAAPARLGQPQQAIALRGMSRNTAYTCLPGVPLAPDRYFIRGLIKFAWVLVPFTSIFVYQKFYLWRFSA